MSLHTAIGTLASLPRAARAEARPETRRRTSHFQAIAMLALVIVSGALSLYMAELWRDPLTGAAIGGTLGVVVGFALYTPQN